MNFSKLFISVMVFSSVVGIFSILYFENSIDKRMTYENKIHFIKKDLQFKTYESENLFKELRTKIDLFFSSDNNKANFISEEKISSVIENFINFSGSKYFGDISFLNSLNELVYTNSKEVNVLSLPKIPIYDLENKNAFYLYSGGQLIFVKNLFDSENFVGTLFFYLNNSELFSPFLDLEEGENFGVVVFDDGYYVVYQSKNESMFLHDKSIYINTLSNCFKLDYSANQLGENLGKENFIIYSNSADSKLCFFVEDKFKFKSYKNEEFSIFLLFFLSWIMILLISFFINKHFEVKKKR
jgi:hypothetical protein